MLQVLDFLSEKSRGFILTMGGAGVGVSPEILGDEKWILSIGLEPLQKIVLILTGIVATLTIVSYIYRFYKWCKTRNKKES